MNLQFGEKYETLRAEVRAFCASSWPLRGDEARLDERAQGIAWRKRALAAGYLHRTVPRAYGGAGADPDVMAETVIRQEFDAAGVPHRGSVQGTRMLVPTLIECGSEEQRREYIEPTLTGELTWCQGYSEPGAGSDLASLQSRAELVGDEWVLRGQKIWTSNAVDADMMFGLFRTEPDAAKHAGISYLLIPMRAAGIDVRPLTMMQGGEDFCEVFFDGVRIPAKNIVGKRGEGWKVTRATLKHERVLIGDSQGARMAFDALVALARQVQRDGRPAIEQPSVRQRLAEIAGYVATQEWAGARMLSAIHRNRDAEVMSELLMAKLLGTNVQQGIAKLALDLIPEEGLLEPDRSEVVMGIRPFTRARWVSHYMFSLAGAIAGGTSNVQRNIIGERLLGLPRDPRPPGA
ncbi:MAG TPA: acyl-CoA dehydrogenase family protein [Myxococcota bacterium]|nr:acyl-CoA dehydrogenase family protein [Myxococcota bacterium]